MAKKPRDYAAEYARRTAGTAKGSAARQAKRGHKPPTGKTEYSARRDREQAELKATGKPTTRMRAKMLAVLVAWATGQAGKANPKLYPKATLDQTKVLKDWIKRKGADAWALLDTVRQRQASMAADERAAHGARVRGSDGKMHGTVIGNWDDFLDMAHELGLDDDEAYLLFYH